VEAGKTYRGLTPVRFKLSFFKYLQGSDPWKIRFENGGGYKKNS